MQQRHPLHMCAICTYRNGVDASTVSLISLEGTYASYNELEEHT